MSEIKSILAFDVLLKLACKLLIRLFPHCKSDNFKTVFRDPGRTYVQAAHLQRYGCKAGVPVGWWNIRMYSKLAIIK